ncbi:MAG: BatD family protein [Vulcanimicrobiota bacterium]
MKRVLWLLLLFSWPALAQGPQVSASLDRTSLGVGEAAVLTVRVSGGMGSANIEEPTIPGAYVRLISRQQSYVTTNGQMTASDEYGYLIQPTRAGQLTIPPVKVEIAGQTYYTRSYQLDVSGASRPTRPQFPGWPQPQPPSYEPDDESDDEESPSMFVRATAEPKKIYQNQPLIFTFSFHHRVRLISDPRYNPINPTGFLRLDFPQESHEEYENGYRYAVSVVRTAFFPLTPGKFTLPPVELRAVSSNWFRPDARVFQSDPIEVTVLPLPDKGKPANFSGAVGNFNLDCKLSTRRAEVGKTITLTRTIEGDGNVELVPDLPLPPMPGFRVYETNTTGQTRAVGQEVRGKKTFTTSLVPTKPGRLVISNLQLAYFDPASDQYEVVTSPDLEVEVTGEALPEANPEASDPSGSEPQLKPLLERTPRRPGRWLTSPLFLAAQALPILALLLTAGLPWLRRRVARGAQEWRSRARQDLERELQQTRSAEELPRLIHRYLSSRLERPTAGFSHRRLEQTLAQAGLDQNLREQLLDWLRECDHRRYAGTAAELTAQERQRALALLRRLKTEWPQ